MNKTTAALMIGLILCGNSLSFASEKNIMPGVTSQKDQDALKEYTYLSIVELYHQNSLHKIQDPSEAIKVIEWHKKQLEDKLTKMPSVNKLQSGAYIITAALIGGWLTAAVGSVIMLDLPHSLKKDMKSSIRSILDNVQTSKLMSISAANLLGFLVSSKIFKYLLRKINEIEKLKKEIAHDNDIIVALNALKK